MSSLDLTLPRQAADLARREGATYAEARLQRRRDVGVILRNGDPEPAVIEDAYGLGVRVLVEGSLGFGATNDLSMASVRELVSDVAAEARRALPLVRDRVEFAAEEMGRGKWSAEEKERLEGRGVDEMLQLLREWDGAIKGGFDGVRFPNRLLLLTAMLDEKAYVNSDGAELVSRVPRLQFLSIITALHEGRATTITIPPGYAQIGETGGWEILKRRRIAELVPARASELAAILRQTGKPPSQPVDVVLGPEVTGLVSHESVGHPGEADRILGREAAQAGESYLQPRDVGRQIGSAEADVSDDPTLPHSMGFYLYDDEGVRARKRKLIERGRITELLQNRATGKFFGVGSNASARAVQHDREPIVRMGNTFVEPGDYAFEELLEGVRLGVYIKSFMEWNIDDKRLNQRYVGLEAWLIQNGELGDVVRNPVLELTTPKFWTSIDARGKDLEFLAGTCGKGDPLQGAPVWTGGPHVRLRNIRLGAR